MQWSTEHFFKKGIKKIYMNLFGMSSRVCTLISEKQANKQGEKEYIVG